MEIFRLETLIKEMRQQCTQVEDTDEVQLISFHTPEKNKVVCKWQILSKTNPYGPRYKVNSTHFAETI